jgi:hypothetical protein
MKSWRVRTLKTAAVCLAAVLLLLVAIRIQQYVFLKRAERLQGEIRALEYGKSTYEEVRPVLDRWQAEFLDLPCTNGSCRGYINIGNFAYRHSVFFSEHQRIFKLYVSLGGRSSIIRSEIRIRNDVLFYKSYEASVDVLPREDLKGLGYSLISKVETVGRTDPRYPQTTRNGYRIGRPSGCEGCIMIYVQFTPSASVSDIQRLDRIDLSCLTRWIKPCKTKADILPAAWQEVRGSAEE